MKLKIGSIIKFAKIIITGIISSIVLIKFSYMKTSLFSMI